MESEQAVVEFPPSLSGLERKYIHQVQYVFNLYMQAFDHPCTVACVQICEKLGLLHESKNQGKERYIVVTKPQVAYITTEVEAEDSGGAESTGIQT